jgi:hypothetical protein
MREEGDLSNGWDFCRSIGSNAKKLQGVDGTGKIHFRLSINGAMVFHTQTAF